MAPGAALEPPSAAASNLPAEDEPVEHKTVKALALLLQKRARDMFTGNYGERVPLDESRCGPYPPCAA